MIVDLQDHFSVYKNQSRQRMSFYKEHFKNVVFNNQSIDFDKFLLDCINIESLKTSSLKKSEDEEHDSTIYQQCLI